MDSLSCHLHTLCLLSQSLELAEYIQISRTNIWHADVFADMWMSVVIQPALQNGGVYKPLETLQNIIDIGWGKLGLCVSCVTEKRAEWTREQEGIWEMMDKWVD